MNTEERNRLSAAFESMHQVMVKFFELRILTSAGGESSHKGKIPKEKVQKLIILFEKYAAAERILREDNGGKCPHCDGDHPPYADSLFRETRQFALECSFEQFKCGVCADLGWEHIEEGDCSYDLTSDRFYHIEACTSCDTYDSNKEAVRKHEVDCGCFIFQHDCEHYNSPSFSEQEHKSTQAHSSTPKLLEGSDEIMADLKTTKVENQSDKFKDVGVRFTEKDERPVITLPEGMAYKTARFWLEKIEAEEEKQVSIDHKFPGFYPPDAALALTRAIEQTYGFASQESTFGFFSIIPPATIGIQADIDTVIQIPWGKMTFHGVAGYVNTGVVFVDGMPVMQLAGVVRKGDQSKIEKLVMLTQQILRERSIYRGKAVIIDFSNFNPDDPRFEPMKAPKFMDLSKVNLDDLILSRDVDEMVRTNLFVPIIHTSACRKAGIPLRRGVLLAGPFGTGKTLTAQVTAKLAVQHGWTYIYITDLKQLSQALAFAKNYGPAVIFGEDIDRITDGERDEKLDEYLNALDGVNRKHDEVLTVFTTNNADNINPAMMRPGRIDAIIPIEAPDAEATMALLRKYGRDLLHPDADLTKVGHMLARQIPAVCREVVERSKLRAIPDALDGNPVVTARHLEQAAVEMLSHVKFINPDLEHKPHALEILGTALGSRIGEAIGSLSAFNKDAALRLAREGEGSDAIDVLVKDAVEASETNGNGKHPTP